MFFYRSKTAKRQQVAKQNVMSTGWFGAFNFLEISFDYFAEKEKNENSTTDMGSKEEE